MIISWIDNNAEKSKKYSFMEVSHGVKKLHFETSASRHAVIKSNILPNLASDSAILV